MRFAEIGLRGAMDLRVVTLSSEMELAGALERLSISEPAASLEDARGLRPLILRLPPAVEQADGAAGGGRRPGSPRSLRLGPRRDHQDWRATHGPRPSPSSPKRRGSLADVSSTALPNLTEAPLTTFCQFRQFFTWGSARNSLAFSAALGRGQRG
jgi:hypothetical protein